MEKEDIVMTTIVGIKIGNGDNEGDKGVILASDLAATRTNWIAQGDNAYRQQTKSEAQKIYVDKKGELAVAMSGVIDKAYTNFLYNLLEGKIDFRAAVEKGFFPELERLTLTRFEGRLPQQENLNGLVVATRYDGKPQLHSCFPLGRVCQRDWTSIGSGSELAIRQISQYPKILPYHISLEEGVDLARTSLEKAEEDIYTGGLDLVVVTPDRILEFGELIKERLRATRDRTIREIKEKLRSN